MKRILILIVILFLGWIIFDRIENMKKSEITPDISENETFSGSGSTENTNATNTEEEQTQIKEDSVKQDMEKQAVELNTPKENTPLQTEKKIPTPIVKDKTRTTLPSLMEKKESVSSSYVKQVLYRKAETENTVKVHMYEWQINISKKEIQSGKVTFEVVNDGIFSHNFALSNGREEKDFGKILPGETKNFSTEVANGELTLYSSKQIDREHDLSKNITVTQ